MNFADIVKEFSNQNALIQLPKQTKNEIVAKLSEVFAQNFCKTRKTRKISGKRFAVMKKNRGATAKTIEHLKEFLR